MARSGASRVRYQRGDLCIWQPTNGGSRLIEILECRKRERSYQIFYARMVHGGAVITVGSDALRPVAPTFKRRADTPRYRYRLVIEQLVEQAE